LDQLVNEVAERVGIPHDKALQAVQVVVGYLKNKLPGPIASQIDGALGSQHGGGIADQAQQTLGNLGNPFDKNP
jgi:uncharacterized protein (DUF2267 family)